MSESYPNRQATESAGSGRPLPAGSESTSGTETASEPSSSAPLPLDQVFDVLCNERRRRVLKYLVDNEGWAIISELAESVAAYETEKSIPELSSDERKRVYVALYQCHLPKMDDVDIIEFNKPRGVVELGPNAAALGRYLADAEELQTAQPWCDDDSVGTSEDADQVSTTEPRRSWPLYYGALVLTGTLLYLLSLQFGTVASGAVVVGYLLALGGCCGLHFREVAGGRTWRPWASGD